MSSPNDQPDHIHRRLLISELCERLGTYLNSEQVKEVYRAYLFGAEAHSHQTRRSGEPYIYHPVAVAYILSEMHMDMATLCAAMLHDVIEDTLISKAEIEIEFGIEVAELVDGVTKLTHMEERSREQRQADNFRKMLLAMNRDIRVIIVKLADRLHNMRTISAMKPASQKRIARETLDIFTPIAQRLGMNNIRIELEERSFAVYYPFRYRVLVQAMKTYYDKRNEALAGVIDNISQHLRKSDFNATLTRKDRHHYGIYNQMRRIKQDKQADHRNTFAQAIQHFRLILTVPLVDDCYRVLGVLHRLYRPVHERFRDFIAMPKFNGYQSLHTVLMGTPSYLIGLIELHIRTRSMHELAEKGITAYHLYKLDEPQEHGAMTQRHAREWLNRLLDMQQFSSSSQEFLEHVKMDLYPEEVYVFTPRGDILSLRQGATPVDYAYHIHTDVGNHCNAAKVDGHYVFLHTPLQNGQMVEILTANWKRPDPQWLDFVVTPKARHHIRTYLKNLTHNEAINIGRRLLDKELQIFNVALEKFFDQHLEQLLKMLGCDHFDHILADIGTGERLAPIVARQLLEFHSSSTIQFLSCTTPTYYIKGTEGLLINFAKCCRPIPGDKVMAFMSKGKGITIHRQVCHNINEQNPEKWLAAKWTDDIQRDFPVDLRIDVHNQCGVLADITQVLSEMHINIHSLNAIAHNDSLSSSVHLSLAVRNRTQLADVLRHLRHLSVVKRITRN